MRQPTDLTAYINTQLELLAIVEAENKRLTAELAAFKAERDHYRGEYWLLHDKYEPPPEATNGA